MAALDFPTQTTGQNTGTQYTGGNGVTYIWDGYKWVGRSPTLASGSNSISNNSNVLQIDSSGNLIAPSYIFPNTLGSSGQVLAWPSSGTTLVWTSATGGNADTGSWTFDTVTATTDGNIIVKAGTGTDAWASLLSNNGANSFWVDDVGAHVTSNFVEGQTTENYWTFAADGVLTLPGGNTRIGNVYGGGDAIVGNTGTAVGVLSEGQGGYVALQWIDNFENIGTTITQVAVVVVNSPFASSTGTVQILTGASTSTGIGSNIWEFGADGTLTAPGHLIPNADLAYDLGSTSSQWRSIYVGTGTIYIGGVALGVNQDNYVTVDGNPIITINTAGNLTIQGDVNIGTVTISDTAPTATTGTQWFDTVEGRTYVATGGVWLDASPTQIPSPETYLDGLAIDGTVIGTANVDGDAIVIDGGDNTKLTVSNNSVTIQVPSSLTRPYWAAEFGGITTAVTTSSYTVGTGAFYDSLGNVYVLGAVIFGDGINDTDSLLLKYDTNGNLLWSRTWHDNSGNNCGAVNQAFAIDSNDRIYWLATDITGYGCWTGYMDTDGNLGLGGIAQGSLGFVGGYVSAVDIACDNSGNYYLAGRYSDGNGNDSPVVIKVDGNNGAPIWTGNIIPEDFEDLPVDGQYRAVTVNPATGDVWAIGDYNDGGLRAMLSKWDINGSHQWTKELVTVTGDVASAVIYNGGYVYTIVNDDPDAKAVVSKFDTDGVMIWASFLAVGELDPIPPGGPGSYNTGAYDLSFDAVGNVYVTGTIPGPPAGQPQLWITKLNPTNGEMLYSRMLATNEGLVVTDSSGFGSLSGHRVGDIYQDKIVVTAVTQSDIDDSTSTNEYRVMVAQLPIDGSVTGVFDNITIANLTGDIDGISSTGTYTVTTLVWSTGTSTAIYSTSSISVSTVTDVVGLTGETITLGSGTAGGTTTTNTWTFVNNNIILPIGGDILDSNGVSVLGATTSTYIEYTDTATDYTSTLDLTYDFNVDVDDAHLDINGNGYWSIGSNNFDTKIFSTEDPGNDPTVIVVRADDEDWTFGPLGWFTLPGGSVISDSMGAIRLEPSGASSSTQALLIYPTAIDGNHIHLTAGGGETDLYLGSDIQYVKVDHSGSIVIGAVGANTSTWTFGTDGVLTLSTASVILGNSTDPNVYIETLTTSTTNTWTFAADGKLTLPNGAVIRDTAGDAVAFGQDAGQTNQGNAAVAIGGYAGFTNQGSDSVAVGLGAGNDTQGTAAVAVGREAGYVTQGNAAVAIGEAAGFTNQGANAIAIGMGAGFTSQPANTIILNASGTAVNGVSSQTNSFYVAPIRNASGTDGVLQYNTSTKEVSYSNEITVNTSTWTFGTDGSTTLPIGVSIDESNGSHFPRIVADTGKAFSVQGYGSTGSVALQWAETASTSSQIAQVGLNKFGDDGLAKVTLTAGTSTNDMKVWEFAADGSTTLPGNIRSDSNIDIVAADGAATAIANINSDGGWNSSPYTNTATTGGTGTGLRVNASSPGSGYLDTITIHTAGSGYTDGDVITITNENDLTATFTISVSTPTWTFGTDGKLTAPGNLQVDGGKIILNTGGNAYVESVDYGVNTATSALNIFGGPYQKIKLRAGFGTEASWTFGTDGGLTFPDATVQTTAYVAANVVNKTSGSWTLATGSNTVSITVTPGGNYQMWVNGNIPNGIVTWNATVSTSNTNVPVVGVQYGWYYAEGNALVLTSMPNQIVGTAGSISTATVATTSSNVFTFGITNNSTSSQVINWGYTTL